MEGGADPNLNDADHGQMHTEAGDDTECDEPAHKRPKIDPKCFPWVIADKSSGTSLRDECVKTRDLIVNYTIDLKLAKAHLLNSGAAPEFPDSEWKSVLSGLAVNLDVIFSGRYSTEHEAKVTQEVGDFTISTRELLTSKTIKTASDWFIAWNQTAAATAFAFPTNIGSAMTTASTSSASSPHSVQNTTTSSSTMTRQSENESRSGETFCSQTRENLGTCTSNTWTSAAPIRKGKRKRAQANDPPGDQRMHACDGTAVRVHPVASIVSTGTSAQTAGALTTPVETVLPSQKPVRIEDNAAKLPKHLQTLHWEGDVVGVSRLASLSETLLPLPDVPDDELMNTAVTQTINNYPNLFAIVTPINIRRLQSLLINHPNRPFISSILSGLQDGFWPWADTQHRTYPTTMDYYKPREFEVPIQQFLHNQRDEEIRLGRFSKSFGTDLLPGMYAMPIHVIPKPHTINFRLISNLSAGDYAPNTMINKNKVTNLPLNTITDLGAALIAYRRTHGDIKLVMWKSDVAQAY